ncbi:hypothetical protein [Nonomuraea rubra]|uniref:hypothetical protein n=1 Tax=Nonomuraea rubra TaxID=46180 RepID=UPI0033E2A144
MRLEELLDEVEPLSHGQRCRHLAARARELSTRPEVSGAQEVSGRSELTGLLESLAEGGQYERSLAIRLAAAAKDLTYVTHAMTDPDPDISRYAIAQAVALGAPAAPIVEIARTAPAEHRMTAYRAIRWHHRTDLAELLIDEVHERWGDREAASLLPACGPEAFAARLADLAHAVPGWATPARRHPLLVLDHAERVLADLPGHLRDAWWPAFAPGVEVAARYAPERVIALLERHWTPRPWRCAGLLLDADPDRTLAIYLVPGRQHQLAELLGRRSVRRRLPGLTDERLGELGRAVRDSDDADALINLLRAVPPSRRDAVFTAAMRGVDLAQRVLSDELLDVLPLRRRVAEARRMLGLRAVAEHPLRTLETTAFLPYDEAEPVLREATRRSDATDRANGYINLIACAGRDRDPETLTRLAKALERLRNEQDPVRHAAITALTGIPGALFQAAHVPFLDRLAEDALAARDCSYQTRYSLSRLAVLVFGQGARRDEPALLECALRSFERLTGNVGTLPLGQFGFGQLSHWLRRGQEAVLVRRLAPFLEAEAAHDRHELAFLLASALGRRGWELPELRQALERALTAVRDSDAVRAIECWLEPPRTRGERVAGLLELDPSTVALRKVFDVLAWQRTDLLQAALGRRDPVGRFAKSGTRQVRYAPRTAVRRWTARQRTAYLRLLERVARNGRLPMHERAYAVRMAGEVPAVEAEWLRPFLEEGADAVLRRAALTALPWTARPQDALAGLLAHAGGNDAHVAVYGAVRAARFVRPAELGAALEPVLAGGKVTARKEAVRLLARHRVPGAMGRLRELWSAAGQHKDIRVAIVSAALELLSEPAAWDVLREAVTVAGDLAAPVLGTRPPAVPERWRAAYGELIVAATRAADQVTRMLAVDALTPWVAHAPGARERLAEIVRDLGEAGEWRQAARGLVAGAGSGPGLEELRRTVRTLAAAPDEPDAGAGRDRPAAQRLGVLVRGLCLLHREDPEQVKEIVPQVAGELPAALATELLAATVDWDDAPRDVLARLAGTIPGVLAAVQVGELLAESAEDVPAERLLPHARWLAGEGEVGALLATELASSAGVRSGWAQPWRELLREIRAGAFPEAAYRALSVRTAVE